jgi:hypothetical protein
MDAGGHHSVRERNRSPRREDLDYVASLSGAESTGRLYGSITRTILDANNPTKTRSVPVPGVAIALSTDSRRRMITTNGEGKLDVRLPPGAYGVIPIVPDGLLFHGGANQVTLPAGGRAPVTFWLISNNRIDGLHHHGHATAGDEHRRARRVR